jgi:deoxyribose-phosphate aldolase
MFENAAALAQLIDHAVLRPESTMEDLATACRDARKYGFAALIVPGWQVGRAKAALVGSGVRVGAVVGYPHGTSTTTAKIVEAMESVKNGAEELDIVMNVGMLRSGRPDMTEIDAKNVVTMTKGVVHKVIIETGLLSPEGIAEASRIAVRSGAEFIKTSTGFGPRGATVDDIRAIRAVAGQSCRIKASGGIRSLAEVEALVRAGAERIGTSAGPAIMEEFLARR